MIEPITTNKNTTINSIVNAFARRSITDKDKISYIKILLLKTMLLEQMYDLRETNIYQQEVKKNGNGFIKALENKIFEDRYFDLHQSDPDAVHEMEKSIELFANEICDTDLGCFSVIIECLKRYKENPEFVKKRLNIIVGDSEDISHLEQREAIIEDIISLPFKAHAQIKPLVDSLKNIYNVG